MTDADEPAPLLDLSLPRKPDWTSFPGSSTGE